MIIHSIKIIANKNVHRSMLINHEIFLNVVLNDIIM
jgi:hypothetical protein